MLFVSIISENINYFSLIALLTNPSLRNSFFAEEYAMNHYLATYPKPIISIWDGITFGGGVGISAHGTFRIATENTLIAMPESAIGFFPDVGASYFLHRLPIQEEVARWMALTGASLKGADAYWAGLATHYIPSHRIEFAIEALSGIEKIPTEQIHAFLENYTTNPPEFSFKNLIPSIQRLVTMRFG